MVARRETNGATPRDADVGLRLERLIGSHNRTERLLLATRGQMTRLRTEVRLLWIGYAVLATILLIKVTG